MFDCWVEVNLDALRHNFRAIKTLIGADVSVIAVVKANAYGHGAPRVAQVFAEEGASMLAVTRLEEALPLREHGVTAPILLLTPPLPDEEDEALAHNLTCCVASWEDAERIAKVATDRNQTARLHLKINTGMGRLGVEPEEAVEVARRIASLPNVELEAAFTHFAFAAEPEEASTHSQFGRFQAVSQSLSSEVGISAHKFHCANSAATLRFPEMRLGCVRPGTLLYGQYPSEAAEGLVNQRVCNCATVFAFARACSPCATFRPDKPLVMAESGALPSRRASRHFLSVMPMA
jgi:alanine racemase